MSIGGTLLTYQITMVNQIGQSKYLHSSPEAQASFQSEHNLESSFETLANVMGTRAPAREKKSRFPEELNTAFYLGYKSSINNRDWKMTSLRYICYAELHTSKRLRGTVR
jgi:hypothetical protein